MPENRVCSRIVWRPCGVALVVGMAATLWLATVPSAFGQPAFGRHQLTLEPLAAAEPSADSLDEELDEVDDADIEAILASIANENEDDAA